jgi:uncharacterized spore protein YtfJ
MSSPAPFGAIADLFERSLNIRHVYGEPVHNGEMTVIPVARVAYAFGGGGGRGPGRIGKERTVGESADKQIGSEPEGAGGGGGVRMTPVGALEIGPQGTRLIHFREVTPWLGAAAVGLVAGWLLGRKRG